MSDLFEEIKRAVEAERFLIGAHADERVRERGLVVWQVVAGLSEGRLLASNPGARPNPTVEVLQTMADGTGYKAVWALLRSAGHAKLVTVHFFDR